MKRFLEILLDAMSQLFFSLSVSMGIMITYGSYVKNDIDLNKATNQIEIFDTGVAILAGMMIIPAVFVFLGNDGMASGPSLIFISLPKVFDAMGVFGRPRSDCILPNDGIRSTDIPYLSWRHWLQTVWNCITNHVRKCVE